MLILSRKLCETIMIGNDVEITVTRISGSRVTLGIKAPSSIKVLRAEIFENPERPDEPPHRKPSPQTRNAR